MLENEHVLPKGHVEGGMLKRLHLGVSPIIADTNDWYLNVTKAVSVFQRTHDRQSLSITHLRFLDERVDRSNATTITA